MFVPLSEAMRAFHLACLRNVCVFVSMFSQRRTKSVPIQQAANPLLMRTFDCYSNDLQMGLRV